LVTVLCLGLVTCLGYLLVTGAWGASRLSLAERLALGYGLGLAISTYSMFVALWLRMPFSVFSTSMLLVSLVAGAGLLAAYRRRVSRVHCPSAGGTTPLGEQWPDRQLTRVVSTICLAGVFGLWLSALIVSAYWPIWNWDALAMFDYRGRVIAATKSLGFLTHEAYWGSFPLLTSLAHAFVYTHGGNVPQMIYPLYYLALLVVFHANVRSISGPVVAGVFTLLLATTPLLWTHATEAFTNLTFTFYYLGGVVYVYRWILSAHRPHLWLGSVLLSFIAWSRYGPEPLFVAILVPVALYSLVNKEWSAPLVLMGVFACVQVPWILYQHLVLGRVGATSLYGIQPSLLDLARWRLTLEYLAAFLASTATQGTIWLVFLCFLLLKPPRLRDRATLLASIVLLGLAGWAGSIYITKIDVNELAKGSGDRLLMTLIPIAAFYCAVHPLMRECLLRRPNASRGQ
jgi:hypothetical protein